MRPTRAQVLAAVLAAPLGLTTYDLAMKLGSTANQVSGIVSKLAAYGNITSVPIPGNRQALRWKPWPDPLKAALAPAVGEAE